MANINRLQINNSMAKYYSDRAEEYKNQAAAYCAQAQTDSNNVSVAVSYTEALVEQAISDINHTEAVAETSVNSAATTAIVSINSVRTEGISELNSVISAATSDIDLSRQTCQEMAERATFGWNITDDGEAIVFTKIESEEE